MSGVLTREAVIDFCIGGMLDDPFLGSMTAENGFRLLIATVEQLFGDSVTWEEVEAAKVRWRAKKEQAIHSSFWEPSAARGLE